MTFSFEELEREDHNTLLDVHEGREAKIADAARRAAMRMIRDWLLDKDCKARHFPGDDVLRSSERAAAYHNAAEYIKHRIAQASPE
jgi:hypothetical protein